MEGISGYRKILHCLKLGFKSIRGESCVVAGQADFYGFSSKQALDEKVAGRIRQENALTSLADMGF